MSNGIKATITVVVSLIAMAFCGIVSFAVGSTTEQPVEQVAPMPEIKPAPETTPEPEKESLSREFKEAFVDGCVGSDESTRAYCQCVIDTMEDEYGGKRVLEIASEYVVTEDLPSEMIDAAWTCSDRL